MENELHEDLKDLFFYDEYTDCVYRSDNYKMTSGGYFEEFLDVFRKQYGWFNAKDFVVVGNFDSNDTENMCVCTHPIRDLCYIQHVPSGLVWQVGSTCVNNIDKNLGEQLEKYKLRSKRIRDGIICKYCEEPLMDLRKKFQKDGYCGKNCYSKDTYVIEFGTYKGNVLKDFLLTEEGSRWFSWVKGVIKKNEYAFRHFPKFSEIINETMVEDF